MNRPTANCQLPGAFVHWFQTALQPACAAALAMACGAARAQTITSAPAGMVGVPVDHALALAATAAVLAAVAMWTLRGARRHRLPVLLAALVLAGGIWGSPPLRAQLIAQFTQPGGETLPISVTPIVAGGALQGFEPVDFVNAAGRDLRIAAIDPPDFNACFPTSPTLPLPPPGVGGPPACAVGHGLAAGASCRVNVDAICKALAAQAVASISFATPSTLVLPVNSTVTVAVINGAASPVAAQNVAAAIPGGSSIAVQATTCGAALAPGASCTITLTGTAVEGPTAVAVAGANTNTLVASVTVTAPPAITITGPVQASRVITVSGPAALALTVTNDAGSAVHATGITVTNKAQAPDMVVDDTNCASVAPGANCTLLLTSGTPYAPATITVSGSNTANSPTAEVAFAHLGGLVFQESGGSGKVVIDAAQGFGSQWTSTLSNIAGAASMDDGAGNTDAIVADAACSGNPASCAAQQCRNIGADWYLPARNELSAVHDALCSNGVIPCTFGGFSSEHWSSTQSSSLSAWGAGFPSGSATIIKLNVSTTRCVRAFTP